MRNTGGQFFLVVRNHHEGFVGTQAELFDYLTDKTTVAVIKTM